MTLVDPPVIPVALEVVRDGDVTVFDGKQVGQRLAATNAVSLNLVR
ncbi:hypothetical protein [Halosegnis longus]